MIIDIQNTQEWSDRDYLELLLYKLSVMKQHGAAYYARKMQADKILFDAARKDVNTYMTLLKKRGYNGDKFNTPKLKQGTLI